MEKPRQGAMESIAEFCVLISRLRGSGAPAGALRYLNTQPVVDTTG